MNITEVRVKLTEAKKNRLQAFCSITIDNDFVVRDLKVIEGHKGAFIAMPSRKLTDRCPKCGGKNHIMANIAMIAVQNWMKNVRPGVQAD